MKALSKQTRSIKPAEVEKNWHLIDADGLVVGRLAVIIANRLRGKHKVTFTPSMDCGDNVIVINCEKAVFTGKKRDQKKYYWHTGFPGGIKERVAKDYLDGKHPDRVIEAAVRRMLPKNKLGAELFRNLNVVVGTEHKQGAQKPRTVNLNDLK